MSGHDRLRRDLGIVAAYAAMVGMLVGAGIFRVTSDAWRETGSSIILAYLVLAPLTLTTALSYAVYLSTPLGNLPGGEYTHISQTFGGFRLAFLGTWLKVISYVGALAYLASAFGDYLLDSMGRQGSSLAIALSVLALFYAIHVFGVRWYGRLQVAMCALLGVSILVLVVPGLFAIRPENYQPVFSGGVAGFARSLPLVFFAFAGFESLAHTAGEVRHSTRALPLVFMRGIVLTTAIFVAMSVVSLGVLSGDELTRSNAPMSDAAAVYLPSSLSWIVGVGALLALATSINATLFVPSRLWIMLAEDGFCPRWMGRVSTRTGTPVLGLSLTFALAAALLVSGQLHLALTVAVFALVSLYTVHSISLLLLPRLNPALFAQRTTTLHPTAIQAAALVSVVGMASLMAVQIVADLDVLASTNLAERLRDRELTSVELTLAWALAGMLIYGWQRHLTRRRLAQAS